MESVTPVVCVGWMKATKVEHMLYRAALRQDHTESTPIDHKTTRQPPPPRMHEHTRASHRAPVWMLARAQVPAALCQNVGWPVGVEAGQTGYRGAAAHRIMHGVSAHNSLQHDAPPASLGTTYRLLGRDGRVVGRTRHVGAAREGSPPFRLQGAARVSNSAAAAPPPMSTLP